MVSAKQISKLDHELGRCIQKVRQSRNVTQEKMAEKLGVSTTWIGYIETGHKRPSLKLLYRIANELDVKVSSLIPF